MKKKLLLIFIFTQFNICLQAQKLKDNFNVIIRTEEGDLNKDGLMDKVIVSMDTVNRTEPLRLQVFFAAQWKIFTQCVY